MVRHDLFEDRERRPDPVARERRAEAVRTFSLGTVLAVMDMLRAGTQSRAKVAEALIVWRRRLGARVVGERWLKARCGPCLRASKHLAVGELQCFTCKGSISPAAREAVS